MRICQRCGGAVRTYQGEGLQYSGKICNCGQISVGPDPMNTPGYIFDILNRLDRIENLLSRPLKGKEKP